MEQRFLISVLGQRGLARLCPQVPAEAVKKG